MPKRIQRKRTRGWKMPAGAVYVGRPTKWGNPWRVGDMGLPDTEGVYSPMTAEQVVMRFEMSWCALPDEIRREWLAPLRGKDLVCWCKEGEPCHADVLLKIANEVQV